MLTPSIQQSILLLIPEVAVICYLLFNIFQLMINPKKQTSLQNVGALASFFAAAAFLPLFLGVFSALKQPDSGMLQVAASILKNGYQIDLLALFAKSVVLFGSALVLIFSQRFLVKHPYCFEFLTIFSLLILGQLVTISAVNTLILYLGIELMSLASCGLVALSSTQPKQAPFAKEAAIKYIVMGAVASGFLLFGLSFWYGAFGNLSYASIQQGFLSGAKYPVYATLGLALITVGFAFKLGLVPFHAWVPDVYQGASYPVTMVLAAIPKVVAFVMFYRFFYEANIGLNDQQLILIQSLALISIIFANALGMVQTKIRRLLAYSTIANMGLMILILPMGNGLGGLLGGISIQNAGSTALYYVLVYGLTSLLTFAILINLNHNQGFEELTDLKGLARQHPKAAMALCFLMLSMMGLPPFIGFYPKLAALQILLAKQQYVFAVCVVLASVMAAFYYLKIIKYMYFDDGLIDQINDSSNMNSKEKSMIFSPVLILTLLALVVLMFMPMQPLTWVRQILT
jgi:NADH-quinone oxidoreductase subunit N